MKNYIKLKSFCKIHRFKEKIHTFKDKCLWSKRIVCRYENKFHIIKLLPYKWAAFICFSRKPFDPIIFGIKFFDLENTMLLGRTMNHYYLKTNITSNKNIFDSVLLTYQ